MRLVIFCCLSAVVFITSSYAMKAPKEITTPKGFVVWYLHDPNTPVISMKFAFRGGARLDPTGKERTAILTADMLSDGTASKTPKQFDETQQDYAFTLDFTANGDFFQGELTMLHKYREQAFQLLKETLTSPRFDDESLRKMKEFALTSLANIAKSPDYLANLRMREMLFHGHRYSRLPIGSVASVNNISLDDIKAYFKENLTRDRLIVIIVGNIDENEAKQKIDEVFEILPKVGAPFKDILVNPDIQGHNEAILLDIPQSVIYMMLPGLMYSDPNFMKLGLLTHIIGGGQSSIMFKEVREKRGLAYDASVGTSWAQEAGYIIGFMGTKAEKTAESIKVARQVWDGIVSQGVTQQVLDDAKTYMINSFPMQFTDTESLSNMLLGFRLSGRPIDYFQKRAEMINAVTLDDMNAFIKATIHPDKLTFLVVGKNSKKELF